VKHETKKKKIELIELAVVDVYIGEC